MSSIILKLDLGNIKLRVESIVELRNANANNVVFFFPIHIHICIVLISTRTVRWVNIRLC